jgi:mannitol/fructose-specific phosphotransferase system IIA component (Ntr-type)
MVQSLLRKSKEAVVRELAELLDQSGRISNVSKLTTDLLNREKKATTGIGGGLAIPHVRTIQAREFLIAVGISPDGLPFASLDDQPVQVFIAMVAPPYEDRTYLQVYPRIGQLFREDWMMDALLDCSSPGEVIRLLADS